MDLSIIPKTIAASIEDTFQTMSGSKASILEISSEWENSQAYAIDIMSVLGLSSAALSGSISLGFPKQTYLPLIEKILGEKHESINRENADACAEILNIIYASARAKINPHGFDFQPAIPTTLIAKALDISLNEGCKSMKIKCASDCGDFFVILALKRNGQK